jgi:hypothetical protein
MSETYPWDDLDETKPVDSAGCLWGEIDRPAKSYLGRQGFALKTPRAPNGWIRTDDPVDLEHHR